MGEVVNLNAARKARARKEAQAKAAANRSRHGRTKAERLRERAEAERSSRTVEGAKLDRAGEEPSDRPPAAPPTGA